MSHQRTNSSISSNSSKTAPHKKRSTNWHEAAACAVQIDLQEYAHLLQIQTEYILGKNNYRIDLLDIKKLHEEVIPKNIAYIFKTYNLFEIKGIGSSLNTDSYYKTIGYAGLLINQSGKRNQYTALDISLSFLSFYYLKSLMKHLQKERKLAVEKFYNGVYHIINEIFNVQIIVTKELLCELCKKVTLNPYMRVHAHLLYIKKCHEFLQAFATFTKSIHDLLCLVVLL